MTDRSADTIESALVGTVLVVTVILSGSTANDAVSACAVFLSFLCSQAAFGLTDGATGSQQQRVSARFRSLYLAKEGFWIATCVLLRSSPLLVSTALFATYPFWRTAIREPQRVRAHARAHSARLIAPLRRTNATGADDSLRRALLSVAE